MLSFWPDISDHDRFAVTTDRVLEDIGKLALPIWDMCSLFVTKSYNHLFKEGERFINELGFFELFAFGTSFLGSFRTGKVD